MEITIIVNDTDPEIRASLNAIYSSLAVQGTLRIRKLPDGKQEWSLTRDGVTRAVLVSINYSINNTVHSIVNKEREESELPPVIVNDTPKSRPKKTPQTPTLFEPQIVRRDEVQSFISFWNERIWLPPIRGTDRQCKIILSALSRPLFRDNYQEGVAELAKSKFLRGANEKRFKLSLDWFIDPDNFDKIIEGKYRDHEPEPKSTPKTYEREEI